MVSQLGRTTALIPLLAFLAAGVVWAGVNPWTNISPEGGGAGPVVADPRNSGTLYAPSAAGLYKSNDGGENWNLVGPIGLGVGSLVVDPQNPDTVYGLISDDEDVVAIRQFKSTDGGVTWSEQGYCCVVAVHPRNSDTLYALAGFPRRGLFRSTDGGASWTATPGLPGLAVFEALVLDPQDSNTIYAAATRQTSDHISVPTVYKSSNGGASWSDVGTGLFWANGAYFVPGGLTIDPKNPRTLYATRQGVAVFKTTDGGATWGAANFGITTTGDFRGCCSSGVLIDPQNSNTLYVLSMTALYRSTNGGGTWNVVNSWSFGQGLSGLNSLTVDPLNPGTLYARQAGLVKTTDGGASWRPVNTGIHAVPFSALAVDPQTSGTIYAGNYKSDDAGMSWRVISWTFGSPVSTLAVDPRTPGVVYAGTSDYECGISSKVGIFKSVEGGANWFDTRAGFGCVSTIVIDPQEPGIVYAGSLYNGVSKSTDGGTSWSPANSGLPRFPYGSGVYTLAIDPRSTGTLYASSGGALYKTTDGGASWNPTGLSSSASALAVDPQNTSTVFAVTSKGLLKSSDGGASWRNVLSSRVLAIAINPQTTSTIYAGTDAGVAQSTDGGESWTPIPGAPPNARLLALDSQNPNTIYAGGPILFSITLNPNAP